jgi:hypothetical protein
MRAKLANLEFLRTKQPHVQMVNTWNAAINDHMVDINEAIGFRAVERWREWQLELSRPTSQLHDFSRVGTHVRTSKAVHDIARLCTTDGANKNKL